MNAKTLINALKALKSVAQKYSSGQVPVNQVQILTTDEGVTLRLFGLDETIEMTYPKESFAATCQTQTPHGVILPQAMVDTIIKSKLKEDIERFDESSFVTVTGQKFACIQEPVDGVMEPWLEILAAPEPAFLASTFTMPTRSQCKALEAFISKDVVRTSLTHIYVYVKDGKAKWYSSDGHQLYRVSYAYTGADVDDNPWVPFRPYLLNFMSRVFDAGAPFTSKLFKNHGLLSFEQETAEGVKIQVLNRTPDTGTAVHFESVFTDKPAESCLTLDMDDMVKKLAFVKQEFATQDNPAHYIFTLKPDKLSVTGCSTDGPTVLREPVNSHETFTVVGGYDSTKLRFSKKLLDKACKVFAKTTFNVTMLDTISPTFWEKGDENSQECYVLMPMRL